MLNVFDTQGAGSVRTVEAQLVAPLVVTPPVDAPPVVVPTIPEDFPDEYLTTMTRDTPLYVITAIRNAPINLTADLI